MLFDTHCHPYLAKELSQNQLIENFFNSWGTYLNSIWCDIESSKKSIELSKKYDWVYASIWIHPTHTLDYIHQDINCVMADLEALYLENSDTIIAIWETWLDYYWLNSLSQRHSVSQENIIALQKKYFIAHIQLAQKLDLPIIIHNRESCDDIFQILQESDCQNFVFHCFSENIEYARKLIKFAPKCKLGLWGVVTFKNAKITHEIAEKIGIEHIIIETDSPYLTPSPFRWKRENEPMLVKEILSKIIDMRDEDSEFITRQIFQNSLELFQIKK
jgi:TatD DNase family protein